MKKIVFCLLLLTFSFRLAAQIDYLEPVKPFSSYKTKKYTYQNNISTFSLYLHPNCLGIKFMATTTKEMTAGAPLPLILNFTFPLLLGNILQQT